MHKTIKVVPVVKRIKDNKMQILAFEHPLAGLQIVKGTLQTGETTSEGCVRELREESGLHGRPSKALGFIEHLEDRVEWHFWIVDVEQEIAETFSHLTNDDGGLLFRFFWLSITDDLDDRWHVRFKQAIAFLRLALQPYVSSTTQDLHTPNTATPL